MANGAQQQSVAPNKPASDEGWQDYKPAEQGWQDYTQGGQVGQAGPQPIQDKSALSAPPQRGLMDDISDWWNRRPSTGGTVGSQGKSPRDIGIEAGKGAAFGAGTAAAVGFTPLRAALGMIAGGKLAESIGIPEWIGAITGGSVAGHGEMPGRFGGRPKPAPEPVEEPAQFPRSTSSGGKLEDEISTSTGASEGTRTLRGDMSTTSTAQGEPKYPIRNRYQRAAQARREAEGATTFSRGPQSTAPAREASPVPPVETTGKSERHLEGPDWTEEVRRRAPGVPPEQKSLRRQMEKERRSGPTPGETQRGEAAARGMATRTKRKVEDAESRRQAKRGAAASENE